MDFGNRVHLSASVFFMYRKDGSVSQTCLAAYVPGSSVDAQLPLLANRRKQNIFKPFKQQRGLHESTS